MIRKTIISHNSVKSLCLLKPSTPQILSQNNPKLRLSTSSFNNLNFILNQRNNFRLQTINETVNKKSQQKQLLQDQTFYNNFYIKMTQANVNYFGHSFIDRSSDKRKDTKWINEQMTNEKSVFVLFHVDKPFITLDSSKNTFTLHRFTYDQIKSLLTKQEDKKDCNLIFLGVEYDKNPDFEEKNGLTPYETSFSPYSDPNIYNKSEQRSWFALDASNFNENIEDVSNMFAEYGKFFEGNFLRLMAIQDSIESSIIAQARSILCWVDRNKFCASCGTQNKLGDSGNKLLCENDACISKNRALNRHVPSNIHYPRVDPVAIMLIVNPARTHVLLGRKKMFPQKMFSCLAGYVEAGESIEEAVRRESFEESGIHTDRVVYHSSQPWPFPSTLMMGCIAYATSDEIKVDTNEIEDAQWFSLDEIDLILKNAHPDKITVPNERTIAHQLIKFYNKNKSKL